MATINEMKELAIHAVKGTAPANFTVGNVDAALADGFKDMAGSIAQFMKNRYDIYEIITTAVDEVVPNKVIDAIGIFAEVKTVGQGQKAAFTRKIGRNRAKKFLTQVGLSGVYETFRLDAERFELAAHARGGACTLDFERMLDGTESMSEYAAVLAEAMEESVYKEVAAALEAAYSAAGVPVANRATGSSFSATDMMKLISTVKAYGQGAVIFALPEFVAAMGPDAIVPVGANYQGVYHPQDIDAIHNTGYINLFRGTPIVQIPQSFEDESNTTKVFNPQFAYVLPTGGEKVVKVVLEGATQMYDRENRDNSIEINAYKKMGVGILTYHNWAVYQNTGL